MDVCGAEGVSIHGLEELASSAYKLLERAYGLEAEEQRTICGKRVCGWLVAVVVVLALLVGRELAPQVIGLLVLRVLKIVLSVGTRLPDVDDSTGNALLCVEILHNTVHERSLAIGVGVADDGVAEVTEWGVR